MKKILLEFGACSVLGFKADSDMNDPRKMNETQVLNQIDSFIKILRKRKKNKFLFYSGVFLLALRTINITTIPITTALIITVVMIIMGSIFSSTILTNLLPLPPIKSL